MSPHRQVCTPCTGRCNDNQGRGWCPAQPGCAQERRHRIADAVIAVLFVATTALLALGVIG